MAASLVSPNWNRTGTSNVSIVTTSQRQGIGSALLAAVEREAAALRLAALFAEVSTTGIRFFVAHGFVVEEERTDTVCNAPAKQFLVRKPLPSQ